MRNNFNKLINTKQFFKIVSLSKAKTITEAIMLSTMQFINKQLISNQISKNTTNITDNLQKEAIEKIIKDNKDDKNDQNKDEEYKQTNE